MNWVRSEYFGREWFEQLIFLNYTAVLKASGAGCFAQSLIQFHSVSEKRKQHINPKSHKHRVVNTPQHPPHPCWGGLACFPSLCESRWQPPNSDSVQSVAGGEKKNIYIQLLFLINLKPGKFNPLCSFVRCLVTVLPTEPALLRENTCYLFSAWTLQWKIPSDHFGKGELSMGSALTLQVHHSWQHHDTLRHLIYLIFYHSNKDLIKNRNILQQI